MAKILKIPFELGLVRKDKRGTSEAPDIIQNFSENIDWEQVEVAKDFETTSKNIIEAARKQSKILAVGGDHSITYSLVKAFSEKYSNNALIIFDAHLDCEDDFLPPTHEDIIKAIVNEKLVEPKNILIVGVRKFYPKEIEFIKDKEIKLGKLEDIQEFIKNKENIYISIDIDVFDPEFAPGTGYPEKNGLKPEEIIPIIKELIATGKVKGADIVEVSPKFDSNNMTSKLAAKILAEFL